MLSNKKSGTAVLAEHIGNLYLNKEFSDITLVIGNIGLPAHRLILAQRSPLFKDCLTESLESTSLYVKLHHTPIDGFKTVLKWMYTGAIEFDEFNNALEVFRVSHMFDIEELKELAYQFLRDECLTVDKVCLVLNEAVFLEHCHLQNFSAYYFAKNVCDVLAHETFTSLSVDALECIWSCLDDATNIAILKAYVQWMKANPDESEHYLCFLKRIPLNTIDFDELISIVPSDLFDANILADIARKQLLAYEKGICDNAVKPMYGIKLVTGGDISFFANESGKYLEHAIGDPQGIIVDLGQRFLVNMMGADSKCDNTEEYSFEISVSEDNINWVSVVNHTCINPCNHDHDFPFDERIVRFIHVRGIAPLKKTFSLGFLFATYENESILRRCK